MKVLIVTLSTWDKDSRQRPSGERLVGDVGGRRDVTGDTRPLAEWTLVIVTLYRDTLSNH